MFINNMGGQIIFKDMIESRPVVHYSNLVTGQHCHKAIFSSNPSNLNFNIMSLYLNRDLLCQKIFSSILRLFFNKIYANITRKKSTTMDK